MSYFIKCWLVTLFAISIGACHTSPESYEKQAALEKKPSVAIRGEAKVVQDLRHIIKGDPVADAKKAMKSGNHSVWVVSNRASRVFPGLDNIDEERLQKLSVQSAPGMGDTVYGNEHIKLREQFIEYAAKYNQIIWNAK